MKGSWIILTGEYPPTIGGLADHVRHLAVALAGAGDEVEVWSPAPHGPLVADPGVAVNALPDAYSPRSLAILDRELAKRTDAQVLVEYVPHAYGMRAMNVPFVVWLAARRRPFWIQFHEVATEILGDLPLRLRFMGLVTHGMAAVLARSAARVFVATPAWNDYLRRIAPQVGAGIWLPDPSNVPVSVTREEVQQARSRLGVGPEDVLIGTFGTYGAGVVELLAASFPDLLARDRRRVGLLIGRRSDVVLDEIRRECRPGCRVLATGALDLQSVAALLAGCAVNVQPYPDGVTTRRTSAMSGLALGVPLVTNRGILSEPIWADTDAIVLAAEPSGPSLIQAVERVLEDPRWASALAERGRRFYRENFSIENSVRVLQGAR